MSESHNTDKANESVQIFISEILSVCKKHGFSIGHEDEYGGFEIHRHDASYDDWFQEASVCIEEARRAGDVRSE